MKRSIRRKTLVYVLALVMVLPSACADSTGVAMSATPSVPTGELPAAVIDPPDDGEPTYYSYSTTISGSGGLPQWQLSGEVHSRTLEENYTWSPSTSFWNIETYYPTEDQLFVGSGIAPAVDLQSSLKTKSALTVRNRLGGTLSNPSQFPIDLIDTPPTGAFRVMPTTAMSIAGAAGTRGSRPDAPQFSDPEARASRADRIVPTPRGAAREFGLLTRQFGPGSRLADGRVEFRYGRGTDRIRLYFNPQIGAVTLMERFNGDVRLSATTRQYRKIDNAWVLAEVVTEHFDPSGNRVKRDARSLANVRMR